MEAAWEIWKAYYFYWTKKWRDSEALFSCYPSDLGKQFSLFIHVFIEREKIISCCQNKITCLYMDWLLLRKSFLKLRYYQIYICEESYFRNYLHCFVFFPHKSLLFYQFIACHFLTKIYTVVYRLSEQISNHSPAML